MIVRPSAFWTMVVFGGLLVGLRVDGMRLGEQRGRLDGILDDRGWHFVRRGVRFGAFWGVLGWVLGGPGSILECLGESWGVFGRSWATWGGQWGQEVKKSGFP